MDTAATTQQAVDAMVRSAAPPQGAWSDSDYMWLAGHMARHVEMTDGRIEEPPMPTETHQLVLQFLYRAFAACVEPLGGIVLFAAFPLRIREGKYREPDLLLLVDAADQRRAATRTGPGADLVLEVVSPDDPARDYVVKRGDYAEAAGPGVLDRRPAHRDGDGARSARRCVHRAGCLWPRGNRRLTAPHGLARRGGRGLRVRAVRRPPLIPREGTARDRGHRRTQ